MGISHYHGPVPSLQLKEAKRLIVCTALPTECLDAGGNKILLPPAIVLTQPWLPASSCMYPAETAALLPIFNNISCPVCIIKNINIPLEEKQPNFPQLFWTRSKTRHWKNSFIQLSHRHAPFSSLRELVQCVCRRAWTLSLRDDHFPLCLQCGPARQGASGNCHSSVLILKPAWRTRRGHVDQSQDTRTSLQQASVHLHNLLIWHSVLTSRTF